jgi:adenine-specific DNA-methyltransferase
MLCLDVCIVTTTMPQPTEITQFIFGQPLSLASRKFDSTFKSIYIDPPYNTDSSAIPYKNSYKHSSWATLMRDRAAASKQLLQEDGAIFVSIDKTERTVLEYALDDVFGSGNHIEELIWTQATANSQLPNYSTNHEYVEVYARSRASVEADKGMFREPKPGFAEVMELIAQLNPDYPPLAEVEQEIRTLFQSHKDSYRNEIEASGKEWGADAKRQDPWRGLYPYNRAEYRESGGNYVAEGEARHRNAQIWVWSEIPTGAPASKQSPTTKDPNHSNFRFYKPIHPVTGKQCPHPQSGWKFPLRPDVENEDRRSFESLDADKRIAWGEDENKVPRTKGFLHEVETNIGTSVFYEYNDGEAELANLFGQSGIFLSPKSSKFVKKFIVQSTKMDSWFSDFFAGSGSSAHGIIQANREDGGTRKFMLVEMGNYFDWLTMPRTLKALYASDWKAGVPRSHDGVSSIIKVVRLESYEDALNNLALRPVMLEASPAEFHAEYMLHYWLDFETKGSPSLLNIEQFADPTGYLLKVKTPGTDEYVEKAVDLIETFNWLIGVHVEHMDRWRGYDARFRREQDPELPEDTGMRLMLEGPLKETDDGAWRFRKIEGYTLRTPGDQNDREKALVIWRKLTGDLEQDNLMLDEWFKKYRLSSQDTEFDVIYVNGSNNLPNLRRDEETWKVRLIEESFHQAMWDVED